MGRKLRDCTGEVFGNWTVIKYAGDRKYLCKCTCGTEKLVRVDTLKNGQSKSCGCDEKRLQSIAKIDQGPKENLQGRSFGHWTVLRYAGNSSWICRCSCGKERIIKTGQLNCGGTHSCGCVARESQRKRMRKYPPESTRLHKVYFGMHERCRNKNTEHYSRYGQRGIKVCEEWSGENGFSNFLKWATENGYNPEAKFGEQTIDRIDNDGNYEPNNCRFVTQAQNCNNTSKNRHLTYNGKTKTIAEWARYFNIPYHIFYTRTIKLHWNVDDAVNTPIKHKKNAVSTQPR